MGDLGVAPAGSLVLANAHILDVSSGRLTHADIEVRDGVITRITGDREVVDPDLELIDLRNRVVMPGLVNMHTHLSLSLPGERGRAIDALSPAGIALYMADGARRTLHAGVTTVRCVAEVDHAELALRTAIDEGYAVGPRIRTAGQALAARGGHGHGNGSVLECDDTEDFARAVEGQVAAGADLIKVMLSGGIAGEHEGIDDAQLTTPQIAAVIETAHAAGRRVTAHVGPASVIIEAVQLGLDCVEHGYTLTREAAELMRARGTAYVPTLLVTRCGEFFDDCGVPEWMQRKSLDAAARHEESFGHALAAGVTIMAGSDMPPFWPFEGTSATVREIEHLADLGLGALGALRAATLTPAEWLGMTDCIGAIEVGRRADLIAMTEDPSCDIRALRGISLVMKDGVVVRDDR